MKNLIRFPAMRLLVVLICYVSFGWPVSNAQELESDAITILDIRDPGQRTVIADPPVTRQSLTPLSESMISEIPKNEVVENRIVATSEDALVDTSEVSHLSHLQEDATTWSKELHRLQAWMIQYYNGVDVDIRVDGPYLVLRFPETQYGSGMTRMPAALRRHLPGLVEGIHQFGDKFDLLIEGHADRGKGNTSSEVNWSVAQHRAEAIRRELVRLQMPEGSLGSLSRGAGLSLADEASTKDRRVEFVFAPRRNTFRQQSEDVAMKSLLLEENGHHPIKEVSIPLSVTVMPLSGDEMDGMD